MSKTKKDLCARNVLFPPSRNSGFFTFPKLFSFGAFIFFASTRKIKRNMTTEKVGGWGGRGGERLERGREEVGEIGGGGGRVERGGGERRERGRVDFFPWHYAAKKKGGKTGRPLATGKTYTTGLHRLNEKTQKKLLRLDLSHARTLASKLAQPQATTTAVIPRERAATATRKRARS